jgi:predicted metal-dependent peptidase
MCAGFDYLEANGIDVDVVVTLTDGYTPFPEQTSVPSVWCISNKDIKSPIGESIHFELTDSH